MVYGPQDLTMPKYNSVTFDTPFEVLLNLPLIGEKWIKCPDLGNFVSLPVQPLKATAFFDNMDFTIEPKACASCPA